MASVSFLQWTSDNRRKLLTSNTSTVDFLSVKVGADSLEMKQTGSGASAYFDFSGRRLGNLADPITSSDGATKNYVDTLVVTGGRVKEGILDPVQLNNTQGIRAAMVWRAANAVPVAGNTVILTDGTNTGTWTFAASETANNPAIGATVQNSMANLANRINLDSAVWGAIYLASSLDDLGVGGCVVVYEKSTAAGLSTSRIYGTFSTPANAQVIAYNGDSEYKTTGKVYANMPSADPAAGRFGFRRQYSALDNGEIHLTLSTDELYTANKDVGVWFTLSAGSVPTATSAGGGGIQGKVSADSNLGLVIVGGVLSVVRRTANTTNIGAALDISASGIGVRTDDTTISADATTGQLKVLDAGITPAKLNTSVAGNGLTGGGGSALTVNPATNGAIAVGASGVSVDFTRSLTNDNAGSITATQVVYIKANGHVDLAIASTANLSTFELGLVSAASIATTAAGAIVVRRGAILSGFTGLTPGLDYAVSRTTAGAIVSRTALSGFLPGEFLYWIGRAISATEILYNPEFEMEY